VLIGHRGCDIREHGSNGTREANSDPTFGPVAPRYELADSNYSDDKPNMVCNLYCMPPHEQQMQRVFVCVHVSLCTTVVCNTARKVLIICPLIPQTVITAVYWREWLYLDAITMSDRKGTWLKNPAPLIPESSLFADMAQPWGTLEQDKRKEVMKAKAMWHKAASPRNTDGRQLAPMCTPVW